jgi:hypothetical protein
VSSVRPEAPFDLGKRATGSIAAHKCTPCNDACLQPIEPVAQAAYLETAFAAAIPNLLKEAELQHMIKHAHCSKVQQLEQRLNTARKVSYAAFSECLAGIEDRGVDPATGLFKRCEDGQISSSLIQVREN